MLLHHPGRQRLGQRFLQEGKEIGGELFESVGVQAAPLHAFRGVVVGLHPHVRQHQSLGRVDVGMGHIDAPVEDGRLPEDDVFRVYLVTPQKVLDALEPHEVHHTCPVGEVSHQPTLTPFAEGLEAEDFSFQLDIRHVAVNLMDVIETAAVDVFIREIVEQVVQGMEGQLLVEDSCPLRAYARQIHDITRS